MNQQLLSEETDKYLQLTGVKKPDGGFTTFVLAAALRQLVNFIQYKEVKGEWKWYISHYHKNLASNEGYNPIMHYVQWFDNETEARGAFLLYAIKELLIAAEEVNERIEDFCKQKTASCG